MKGKIWIGMFVAVALLAWKSAPEARVSQCASLTSDYSVRALSWSRYLMTSTVDNIAEIRDSLRIPAMDSSLVTAVQVDSVCRRAAAVINEDSDHPDTLSQVVHLVSFNGRRYFAVVDMYYRTGYVLDSALTTVLERTSR